MPIALKSFLGIAICAGVAVGLSIFLEDAGEIRLAAPFLCLGVLFLTTSFCGRLSGLIGSVVASLAFAYLLFAPRGSFEVGEPAGRTSLILSQLAAIGVILSAPRNSAPATESRKSTSVTQAASPIRRFLKHRGSE